MGSVLQDCLGPLFEQLSPLVKQAHVGDVRLVGDVKVERGNAVARMICNVFGMPPESDGCQLIVRGEHSRDKMTWNRHFDNHVMNSNFHKQGSYLVEKLGPVHMAMQLSVEEGALVYRLSHTRLFGIPVPRFISPSVSAVEQQEENVYRFNVVVSLPVIGTLVRYFGDMRVETLDMPEGIASV